MTNGSASYLGLYGGSGDGTGAGGTVELYGGLTTGAGAGGDVKIGPGDGAPDGSIFLYDGAGVARLTVNTYGLASAGSGMAVANVGANSCGTDAATIAGNANSFNVTVGATSGTQCRVAFPVAAPNRWNCTVTNETSAALVRATYVDTTHVDLLGVFGAADVLTANCWAR